jgi:hypothetical protein
MHSGRAAEFGHLGGLARNKCRDLTEFPKLEDAGELLKLVLASILELRSNRLTCKVATAIACLSNTAVKIFEVHKLEEMLKQIRKHDEGAAR